MYLIFGCLGHTKGRKSCKGSSYFVKGHWSLSLGEGTGWDGSPAVPQNQTITQNLLGNPTETFPRKCCPEASPGPWLLLPLWDSLQRQWGGRCQLWALPGTRAGAEESHLALALHPRKWWL